MSSDMGQPVVNIEGEWVALGPRTREHLPLFARWRNDFAVARTFDTPRAHTIESLAACVGRLLHPDRFSSSPVVRVPGSRSGWRAFPSSSLALPQVG